MKMLLVILFLISLMLLNIGCAKGYWPQTLEAPYYEEGAREVKEDIDDVSGARTL